MVKMFGDIIFFFFFIKNDCYTILIEFLQNDIKMVDVLFIVLIIKYGDMTIMYFFI
jgi:hypothetical protein